MENSAALQEKYKEQLMEIYKKAKEKKEKSQSIDVIKQVETKSEVVKPQEVMEVNVNINPDTTENSQENNDNERINDNSNQYSNQKIEDNKNKSINDIINDAYTGKGSLVVNVTTGSNSIPIEDALIIIEKDIGNGNTILVATTTTNANGTSIDKIELQTKAKNLSLSPDNKNPFSQYRLLVKAKGFITKEVDDVSIFDGIESVENINLMPA